MSGHSKWATIKHKKGAADVKRGKLFAKLIKQVEVAARQGGGDIDANPALRTMFQKARDNSVPLDTIERAVKRGTGELEGVTYEVINYEGYAPGGVALYVECLSDNRNRTGAEIKSLFSKAGGSLAEPGAVAWQFERTGLVTVELGADEDELMMAALDLGATDVKGSTENFSVLCEPTDTMTIRDGLEAAGFKVSGADLTMLASSEVLVSDLADAKGAVRVMEELDDHDDVQEVYSNADFPDEILAELGE